MRQRLSVKIPDAVAIIECHQERVDEIQNKRRWPRRICIRFKRRAEREMHDPMAEQKSGHAPASPVTSPQWRNTSPKDRRYPRPAGLGNDRHLLVLALAGAKSLEPGAHQHLVHRSSLPRFDRGLDGALPRRKERLHRLRTSSIAVTAHNKAGEESRLKVHDRTGSGADKTTRNCNRWVSGTRPMSDQLHNSSPQLYQPMLPGMPLKGPASFEVIHPP